MFVGVSLYTCCVVIVVCVLGVVCGNKYITNISHVLIISHVLFLTHSLPLQSYYFQAYTPKTAVAPASHKHLHHWVFLIDANVNDYEEDNADYGHASIGKISAHLTARNMGLEDTPASFGEIIPLVMTRTLQRVTKSRE